MRGSPRLAVSAVAALAPLATRNEQMREEIESMLSVIKEFHVSSRSDESEGRDCDHQH